MGKKKNGIIKEFIQNMMQGFNDGENRVYLLKIINLVVDHYLPSNSQSKSMVFKSKIRLTKLQIIMKDCGLLSMLIEFTTDRDIHISAEAIKLLSNMLCESNQEVIASGL